jgi:SpoVK/Ycf46/Vps4 family AAA+-type ATPase
MMEPSSSHIQIDHLIRAGYPLLYVVSSEEERVEEAIRVIGERDEGSRQTRQGIRWSITEGFVRLDGTPHSDVRDPIAALEYADNFEGNAIFVLRDFHPYLKDPSVVRKLRDLAHTLYHPHRRHIVMLSPMLKLPIELEKQVAVVDFDLPSRDDLRAIVDEVIQQLGSRREELKVHSDPDLKERVVEAALGLTEDEARHVFARSLVAVKDLDIDQVLGEKKNIIRKSGLLEYHESRSAFGDVGGLDQLKSWLKKRQVAFSQDARDFGLPLPKGILMIGVPGCGKSLTAKAVSALWQMPLLRLDVGKVFSSLVGSSEENIRQCIRTAEAVAPSILWLDELEKGFAGMASSGQSDAGTTARVFASFITWLQEKSSAVFVIATANDVTLLPPELLRKGRFDEIFFVDLPKSNERSEILRIHIEKNKRVAEDFDIPALTQASQGYSGSEIEQAIISAMYDAFEAGEDIHTDRVREAIQEIVPLSQTMKEKLDAMRHWARTRARAASSDEGDLAAVPESRIEM